MVQERDVTTNGKPKEKLVEILQEDGTEVVGHLPPIDQIIIPSTLTKSATIRWLHALGYEVREIYQFLGCRYQMVRNIVTTIPKRAAREDLPPLKVRYKPESTDIIQDGLDAALDASLMTGRKERIKQNKDQARLDRQGRFETGNDSHQDESESEDLED